MRFTIAIPVFKARFFEECLESILNQSYQGFEVVLLNDASPDDFDTILSRYSDKRIRYYKNETNTGIVNIIDNWNKLLNFARGEFIILMGDDDKLQPECLSTFASLIERYPQVDVFHARVQLIDEASRPFGISTQRLERESPCTFILNRLNKAEQYIGDFCIRREKLLSDGGYPKYPFGWCTDDVVSFQSCIPYGVVHTQEAVFLYRSSRYTISNSAHNELKVEGVCDEMKWFDNFVATYRPEEEEEKLLLEQVKRTYPIVLKRKAAKYLAEYLGEVHGNIIKFHRLGKRLHLSKYTRFFALEVYFNKFVNQHFVK